MFQNKIARKFPRISTDNIKVILTFEPEQFKSAFISNTVRT